MSDLRAGVDDPHTWRALLGDAAGPTGRLLVLVDRFEELFTECHDEEVRYGFVQALQAASAPSGSGAAAGRWQIGGPVRHHTDHPVFGVALSPDGSLPATAGQDETVRLWRTGDRRRLRTLDEHDDTVFAVAFSPDGTLPATAGRDCTVRLYLLDVLRRPGSRPAPVVLSGHTGPIVSMWFDRSGDTLVTHSRDGTARLWDIPGRAPKATLRGHTGRVQDAVLDGDDTLHTVSRDGTWRTWDLDPRRVAAHVRERVPPPTRAYRERVAPGTPYRDGC